MTNHEFVSPKKIWACI